MSAVDLVAQRPGPAVTGAQVSRNVVWNLLGQAAPVLAALLCIPVLTRSLGPDRFGLLALSWTFVGYFSIFDLGLGQAMTRGVAQKLAVGEHDTVHVIAWTTLVVMLALGVAGLIVAWVAAPVIVHALRAPGSLQAEALRTMQLLALSIPLVIVSVGVRGILRAHMQFKLINAVGIPLGMWTYLGPILALRFSHSLVLIVGTLLAGRLAGLVLYLGYSLRIVPSLRKPAFRWTLVRPLLTFGGWLTLDSLVDPLTNLLDRLLIGSLISVAAVAFYSVPYQLAAQGWILASALTGVLFPVFSLVLARDHRQALFLFRRAVKYLLFAMFPIVLIMVALARPGLQIWLGAEYARRSAPVLQIVAIGVLITSLGSVAGTFNASRGRPDVNAKLGLAKFVLHFAPAWWVLSNYGIVGIAALWMACAGLETVGMMLYALRAQHVRWTRIGRRALHSVPLWIVLAVAALNLPLGWKLTYLAAVTSATALVAWRNLMTREERQMVRSRLGLRPLAGALPGS